jgi:hypothetical protein
MAGTERRRRRIRHVPPTGPAPPTDPAPRPASAADPVPAPHPPPPPAAPAPSPAAVPDRPRRRPAPPPRDDDGQPSAETRPVHDPEPEDREVERGLRGLVGGGSSQVSRLAAMRARDAARPGDADLAAAEENLVIIRRGWVPRDPLTR